MKKYDSYKDSGIDWIGEIPSHWGLKRFKSLFIEHSGNGFPHEFQGNETGDIPFYKVSSLNGDGQFVEHSNNYVSMDNILKMKWNIVPANTILTAKIGESLRKNHRKISKTPSIIDNNCLGIESKMIDKKLAFYMLKIIDFDLFTNPGAVPSVSMEKLRYHIFPITNEKEEQSAIANYLDHKTSQIDHLIAKKEQFIQLLEEERIAVINQAVTKGLDPSVPLKDSGIEWLGEIPEHWEVKSFRFCIDILTDYTANGSFASLAQNVTYFDSGYSRLVRLTDLRVNLENEGLYVDEGAHNFLKKSELFGGELLIANVGAYAGLVLQMPLKDGKFTLGPNMFLLRLNQNTEFFIYQLNSRFCAEQLKMMAVSSAQPKLNKENIRQLKVVTPPVEEQNIINKFIKKESERIETLISKSKEEIELLKEYKTALISEVVTGKVDVRNEKLNIG